MLSDTRRLWSSLWVLVGVADRNAWIKLRMRSESLVRRAFFLLSAVKRVSPGFTVYTQASMPFSEQRRHRGRTPSHCRQFSNSTGLASKHCYLEFFQATFMTSRIDGAAPRSGRFQGIIVPDGLQRRRGPERDWLRIRQYKLGRQRTSHVGHL